MSEESTVKDGSLDEEILIFKFTVGTVNNLLKILGDTPFVQSAGFINDIQRQAGPQVDQLIANKKDTNESQAVT